MRYEEALQYAINGDSVFVIGSGFSIGAKNGLAETNNRLKVGSELAYELAALTDMDSDTQLEIVSQEYIDAFGESAMVNYLKQHYTVEMYEDYYRALGRLKNYRFYSTNYDDLVEKVCKDCGKKVKGYNIDSKITKVNKDRMVLHLNGYVNDLEDNYLPDSFKLSHLSYNNMKFFNTPWYAYLNDELHSAKVIFVIGLSFKTDLDIRRIIADEELKDKIFIIEQPELSESNRKFLNKYGRVLLIGIKNFLKI